MPSNSSTRQSYRLKLLPGTYLKDDEDIFLVLPVSKLVDLFEPADSHFVVELLERLRGAGASMGTAGSDSGSVSEVVEFSDERYARGFARMLLCLCGRGRYVSLTLRRLCQLPSESAPNVRTDSKEVVS
jgi:hypothetical protein